MWRSPASRLPLPYRRRIQICFKLSPHNWRCWRQIMTFSFCPRPTDFVVVGPSSLTSRSVEHRPEGGISRTCWHQVKNHLEIWSKHSSETHLLFCCLLYISRCVGVERDLNLSLEEVKVSVTLGVVGEWDTYGEGSGYESRGLWVFFFLWIDKRELKIIHIYGCRYNERIKSVFSIQIISFFWTCSWTVHEQVQKRFKSL
jgi:hypothetical protein